jgi:hypothetical protein
MMDDYRTCVRHSASWQVWKNSPLRRTTPENWTLVSVEAAQLLQLAVRMHVGQRAADYPKTSMDLYRVDVYVSDW